MKDSRLAEREKGKMRMKAKKRLMHASLSQLHLVLDPRAKERLG